MRRARSLPLSHSLEESGETGRRSPGRGRPGTLGPARREEGFCHRDPAFSAGSSCWRRNPAALPLRTGTFGMARRGRGFGAREHARQLVTERGPLRTEAAPVGPDVPAPAATRVATPAGAARPQHVQTAPRGAVADVPAAAGFRLSLPSPFFRLRTWSITCTYTRTRARAHTHARERTHTRTHTHTPFCPNKHSNQKHFWGRLLLAFRWHEKQT